MNTFEESVDAFLKGIDNIGDAEQPLVIALKKTAQSLDKDGVQASMVNQFRLLYAALLQRVSGDNEEVDPLEALLNNKE